MNGPPARPRLLLASASPRRRRLMAWLGVPYDVASVDTPEDLTGPLRAVPPVLARSIAAEKAAAARATDKDALIVACDTIVVLDRRILGKPADLDDARGMLADLSGRTHDVITGVAVFAPGADEPRTFAVTTHVLMNDLDEGSVAGWVDKGELLGCAGAYNIESHLATVADSECYQNVAGLPLCHLYRELTREGVEGLESPVAACDESRCARCALGRRVAVPARPAPRC